MATELYRVRSTKADRTEIIWLAFRREPPVPYAEATIKGLSAEVEANERQRQAVDELFTYEEAEQWLTYLRNHYGELDSEIVAKALPLEPDAGALSYSSGERIRPEARKEDYPFSDFEVHRYEVPAD